jgi:hypothetical protein
MTNQRIGIAQIQPKTSHSTCSTGKGITCSTVSHVIFQLLYKTCMHVAGSRGLEQRRPHE